MSTSTPTPVVVVSEETRRRRGLLWVAGGAALLLGGSTFALWSASDTFSGGTITAGDLNVVATRDTTFWDVSGDRTDATETVPGTDGSQPGHSLDPADASTWRIVPGDKVAATFSADVTLEGDNLVGLLSLDGLDDRTGAISGLSYSYEIYQAGSLVVQETALPATADAPLLHLAAPGTGQADGASDATAAGAVGGAAATTTVFPMSGTTEDLTVVVYGSFFTDTDGDFTWSEADTTVTGRTDATLASTLAGLTLQLTQVRDTGAQF
ncbi:alternate-type signal peptide domain-containing protein [Cellulosimicrobium cellulans]|uniref:alternate-type signal peptide domain-containing protein n=1 Tax=Cellulosimicrobium cellulans TaxID=1710 RepID=UPI00130DDE69|nr:alternate-type signal peptide domain-containing protein [Cellulosimicrobium cellulans]